MVSSHIGGRTLGDNVVRALREAITDGEVPPGSRIIDAEMADRLQVSRATVRAALQQLMFEGLVVSFPHRGYFVAEFRPSDVIELLEMRSLLEGRVAEDAASSLTDADIAHLEAIAEALGRKDYAKDVREIRHLDIEFHQVLARRCTKRLLVDLWSTLNSRLVLLDVVCRDILHITAENCAARHYSYIEALRTRDPHRAREAAESHYRYHRDRYLEVLSADEANGEDGRGSNGSHSANGIGQG